MIHYIGDSHVLANFGGMPGAVHYVGPVTMKRVGVKEDALIADEVASMSLAPGDWVVFNFGEIDMRCYVKPILEHRKVTVNALLRGLVKAYCDRIASLPLNGAKVCIVSVTPPSTRERAETIKWPVAGTDGERALYTRKINRYLKDACRERQWRFMDTHALYADPAGMLPADLSDGKVHVRDNKPIRALVKALEEPCVK